MQNIVIATIKEWNISNYYILKDKYTKFNFHLITNKKKLTKEDLDILNPAYIFFLHWSWIIPKNIYEKFNCVVFHMTDLPYGRGGSPLQNMIVDGVKKTKISAIKVSHDLDSGDIYIKESLDISTGSAEEIFTKASKIIIEKMIPKFLTSKLYPKPQEGEITKFKRRTPSQSNISDLKEISKNKLYDFIRMLDAEGYPKAYFEFENYKIKFSDAEFKDGILTGTFEVVNND